MARFAVALTTLLAVAALAGQPVGAQQDEYPLLASRYNCSSAQSQFGGQPQPAVLGETITVELATDCFLAVGVQAVPGDTLRLTYLSGQFDEINLAFYESSARPGASFRDPANARLGVPTAAATVPGLGASRLVLVALQGVGGPASGTAAIRIDGSQAPPATSAPTTASPPTTSAPATTAAPTATHDDAVDESDDAGFPNATEDDSGFPDADDTATETEDSAIESAATDDSGFPGQSAPADPVATDDSLPWWLVATTVLLAGGSAVWLMAQAAKRRRGTIVAPWDRPMISWTMQHAPPTGSCSSNARALVDTDDDGSLEGYTVSALFTLPGSGKRSRSTIGDPLLAQLENLWLTGGSGEELRSAVDTFVNNLCHRLDQRGTPTDATLLAELTRYDVVVDGDVYACTDGEWRMYPHWTQAPGVPADEHAQHNLVQVAALGVAESSATEWRERSGELTEVIARLIENRRAPVGLWVFD